MNITTKDVNDIESKLASYPNTLLYVYGQNGNLLYIVPRDADLQVDTDGHEPVLVVVGKYSYGRIAMTDIAGLVIGIGPSDVGFQLDGPRFMTTPSHLTDWMTGINWSACILAASKAYLARLQIGMKNQGIVYDDWILYATTDAYGIPKPPPWFSYNDHQKIFQLYNFFRFAPEIQTIQQIAQWFTSIGSPPYTLDQLINFDLSLFADDGLYISVAKVWPLR